MKRKKIIVEKFSFRFLIKLFEEERNFSQNSFEKIIFLRNSVRLEKKMKRRICAKLVIFLKFFQHFFLLSNKNIIRIFAIDSIFGTFYQMIILSSKSNFRPKVNDIGTTHHKSTRFNINKLFSISEKNREKLRDLLIPDIRRLEDFTQVNLSRWMEF